MSWDAELHDAETGEVLTMPETFIDGGTYIMGGTNGCVLNITYNYTRLTEWACGVHLRTYLEGKKAKDTTDVLRKGIKCLQRPCEKSPHSYWIASEPNVHAMLSRLLSFAEAHPEGIWRASE